VARSRNFQKSRIDGRYPSDILKLEKGRTPSTEFNEDDVVDLSDFPEIEGETRNSGFGIWICEKYTHIEVVRLEETAHAVLYWH